MEIIRVRLISSSGKTRGCEKAPVEILKALKDRGSNEKKEIFEYDKLKLEEIHVDLKNLDEANYLIYENSKESFEKNFKTLFVGGDHSISYSILRAFNKVEEDPLLIVFDSHADCLLPGKYPSNEDWLRKLSEEGFENIILISARDFQENEIEYLKKSKITLIGMDVLRDDLEGVCDIVMERARNSSGFYISIDIDCVDPAFAPAGCHLEPGGLSSSDLVYFIKRLKIIKNFRGADVVEINPDKDINNITVLLGAKLLAEMIK